MGYVVSVRNCVTHALFSERLLPRNPLIASKKGLQWRSVCETRSIIERFSEFHDGSMIFCAILEVMVSEPKSETPPQPLLISFEGEINRAWN